MNNDDWIQDLAKQANERAEKRTAKNREHNVILAKAASVWSALIEQIEKDCARFGRAVPECIPRFEKVTNSEVNVSDASGAMVVHIRLNQHMVVYHYVTSRDLGGSNTKDGTIDMAIGANNSVIFRVGHKNFDSTPQVSQLLLEPIFKMCNEELV